MSESEYKRKKEELQIEREKVTEQLLKLRKLRALLDDSGGGREPTTDVYEENPTREVMDSDEDEDDEEFNEDDFGDLEDEDDE